MPRTARLFLAFCFLFTLTACGPSNYVRLQYIPEHPAEAVMPDAPVVSIVEFTDLRSTDNIGQRSDKSPFIPVASVPRWVSNALVEELTRRGVKTAYARSAEEVEDGSRVVTGEIRKVWIEELNKTDFRMNMELSVKVDDAPATTFSNSLTDQFIPRDDVPQRMATQGLKDIMEPIVNHVLKAVHK